MPDIDDPFREARAKCAVHLSEFQGEAVPMLLSLKQVRAAAKDWRAFNPSANQTPTNQNPTHQHQH